MLGGIQEKYQKVKNKNVLAALEFQNASQGFFAFLHELGHFNNVQQTFQDVKHWEHCLNKFVIRTFEILCLKNLPDLKYWKHCNYIQA